MVKHVHPLRFDKKSSAVADKDVRPFVKRADKHTGEPVEPAEPTTEASDPEAELPLVPAGTGAAPASRLPAKA